MLCRLREMERTWRERSRDRLHRIIERIDSMLSGNSMFFEDVAEAKRTFGAGPAKERCDSWTNGSSSVAAERGMILEDRAANSAGSHDGFPGNGNDTRSSLTTSSKSQDRPFDLRSSSVPFKETNRPSHLSSPDSAGTYIVEMSSFNKNIDEVAVVAEEIESLQTVGSDGSRISNATFVIENERA